MIGVTLVVTFVFIILALSCRRSGAALGIVIMSMMLWPEFLRIPIGLAEMSVPRLVALVLLIKYFIVGQHRGMGYGKLDTLVIFLWVYTVLATLLAGAEFFHVSQMIGRGFDTVLMYFLARMTVRSPEDVKGLYTGLAITAVCMGLLGVYEAAGYASPYALLTDYRLWLWYDKDDEYRYGFLRAKGSTLIHIYFGMAMMLFMGFIWSLRGYVKSRAVFVIALSSALLGVLSSMSSGPWLACIALIIFVWFEKHPRLIKPGIYLAIAISIFFEIISNRHFYNLIDYLALDPQTAWYRTMLLEVAFSQWREYWLVGVGSNWPHHWGEILDGRDHIDVVNHFLIVALYGGLPALLMYLATHYLAMKKVIYAWGNDLYAPRRYMLFVLAAALIALDFSSMSVGLFGPPLLLSNILLGAMVSAAVAWRSGNHEAYLNEKTH